METEFLQLNPVLASQDVTRDVKWYEEKLGFKKSFDCDDDPMNYAGVSRQGLPVFKGLCSMPFQGLNNLLIIRKYTFSDDFM